MPTPDESPASEQGREQAEQVQEQFRVRNHLAEPVGPRHGSRQEAYDWLRDEHGHVPEGYSIEPVWGDGPEKRTQTKQNAEIPYRNAFLFGAGATLLGTIASTSTGNMAVVTAHLAGGLTALLAVAFWMGMMTVADGRAD